MKVFLSYAKNDSEIAKRLYADLEQAGFEPWREEDILPGQKKEFEIKNAIEKGASHFLVLLSSNSVSRRSLVLKHLKWAMETLDEFPHDEIFIIPARLDECEISDPKLQQLQYVDLFQSYEDGLDKILKSLGLKKSDTAESSSDPSGEKDSFTRKQNNTGHKAEQNKNQDISHSWVLKVSAGSAIAFLIILLIIAVFIPNPTAFQIFVFRVVLSLAAAGFGATIPEFLKVDLPLWGKGLISAGGAIILFAMIYNVNPPELIHQFLIRDTFKKEDFVFVPSGSFDMGCINEDTDCEDNEKPPHKISVNSFWIGKYEVTQGQWEEIMGKNSKFQCKDCPVNASWNDIQSFIFKLNKLNEKTGKKYRLPTEAEWEFACRSAEKNDRYSGGNEPDQFGWYDLNNSQDSAHPVRTKQPNTLGIYDMSGNVWEWCQDVYCPDAYNCREKERVIRGGSWRYSAINSRCTSRRGQSAVQTSDDIGFRLVMEE